MKAWKTKSVEKFKKHPYFEYEDNFKIWKVSHLIFAQTYILDKNNNRHYTGPIFCLNTLTDKITEHPK